MRVASLIALLVLGVGGCPDRTPGGDNNNGNGNEAFCGDGVVEVGEACDEGTANSDVLPNACRTTCVEAGCGDGVADALDQCDGADLAGQTCATVGDFNLGELACASGCVFDTSGCSGCGNGVVDGAEECDEGAANCDDDPGCACATNCTVPGCGNGVWEAYLGEECDLGAANCDAPGCECSTTCEGAFDACGFSEEGLWIEIDFTGAATTIEPTWRYSPTPGWGVAEWTPSETSAPFIHLFGNVVPLVDDVIGRLAYLATVDGESGRFSMVFGLEGLQSYSYASVCIEGRSLIPGAPSQMRVFNGLNGCGTTTSIDPDPQVHAVGVNLSSCYLPGNGYQDVYIHTDDAPDVIGVLRVRLTLHDPVF